MEWTYSNYTSVNAGISIGLASIITVGVFSIFYSSEKGKEFVTERIIGIDPSKAQDEDEDEDEGKNDNTNIVENTKKNNSEKESSEPTKNSTRTISILFCLIGSLTVSISAVLIFQGCFLTNTRLLPGNSCPQYPMDCFVFNGSKHQTISENITFHCDPTNKTHFPIGISDPTAWCFGWIIQLQTTKNILDQLGVCTALIGLFSTLLAIIIYLGKSIKTLILCIILIGSCIIAVILLVFYKWSYTPLTYAVLVLVTALAIFGLILFCIISKKKNIEQKRIKDTNKKQASIKSITSSPIPPLSTITLPSRIKILQRSSKVTPK